MIGYLYQITNKVNGKKYIGKTNDINRRVTRHYYDLNKGVHHSHKLQRAYDKYGKENFSLTYETFYDISEEELAQKEIQAIQLYDSYYNGYNETLGGEGHASLFDFETTVLIYQLGKRYDGIKHLLANYYNCDRTTITSIMNRESLGLVEYDQSKLQELIKKANITDSYLKGVYKNNYSRQLTQDQVLKILSAIELRGYSQAACGRAYGVRKDLIQNIVCGQTYKSDFEKFKLLTQEQKEKLVKQMEQQVDLKQLQSSKKISTIKISQQLVDYIMDNKDKKTAVVIASELGIDRKRVSRIIKKETYKNLVEDWEKRHFS